MLRLSAAIADVPTVAYSPTIDSPIIAGGESGGGAFGAPGSLADTPLPSSTTVTGWHSAPDVSQALTTAAKTTVAAIVATQLAFAD